MDVAHLRRDDLGTRRSSEIQELIGLVRGDIAEDAAIARLFEKPGRTCGRSHAVRPEPDRLHDVADGARLDQFGRPDRRLIL